jgi:predicted  nucleic acid-binding Zn-ribbon protein
VVKKKTTPRKVTELIKEELEEINSNPEVIKDSKAKLDTVPEIESDPVTKHEDEAIKLANTNKRGSRDSYHPLMEAFQRHKLLAEGQYTVSSDLLRKESGYILGCKTDNTAFLVVQDFDTSCLVRLDVKDLEKLKFHIDDVLVEMGLTAIGVKSENAHMWRTAKRSK